MRRAFPWILILLLIAVGGAFLWANYQSVSKSTVDEEGTELRDMRSVQEEAARAL